VSLNKHLTRLGQNSTRSGSRGGPERLLTFASATAAKNWAQDAKGRPPPRRQTRAGAHDGLSVEVPQVREAAEPFVSKLFSHSTKLLRTRPLEAMVVGAFVRGL